MFFAPTVVAFLVLCLVNVLLIRIFAGDEVAERRANIMEKLVDSVISDEAVVYQCSDLIDRKAWKSLSLFWRFM